MDDRCFDCDSRYCGSYCKETPTSVYVTGHGWTDRETGIAMQALGRDVQWPTNDGWSPTS